MKTNIWYVIGKIDDNFFGASQVTPKQEWFNTFEEADIERIYLQPDYEEKLVVLERTCRILK